MTLRVNILNCMLLRGGSWLQLKALVTSFSLQGPGKMREPKKKEKQLVEKMPIPVCACRISADEANLLQGVVDVDDDNMPAPENTPTTQEGDTSDVFGDWGHNGICN